MGLANNSFVSSPAGGGSHPLPHPPARPPAAAAQSTLVPVNLKAMPASSLAEHDKFVFRNDSAGLGVPRGTLGKLNSFSNQTAQHGMASTNIYYGGAQRGEAQQGVGSYSRPSTSMSASPASSPSHSSGMQSGMQSASGMGGSHASAPAGGGGGRH